MRGFPDVPATTRASDEFGITHYIQGLTSFVLECNTPMTVAIQGDWGSGKTSMMGMMREEMADRAVLVWFNTWQFSQFNMGDNLVLSFMSRLTEAIETDADVAKGLHASLSAIGRGMKRMAVVAADTFIGGEVAKGVERVMDAGDGAVLDPVKAVSRIREQFQQCIDAAIRKSGMDRVVVFIDDLDRLPPAKAVEMLEVLKLFVDCESTVFVLAVDYEVVLQGVKAKYGEQIGEEKGRSFFDKIIQVPFKVPVMQYDVAKYVKDMLKQLGIQCRDDELRTYIGLIQTSVGCNPRAMKRLFNAFLLLLKVAPKAYMTEQWNQRVLFAVLCMQQAFERVYNYLAGNRHVINEELLGFLAGRMEPGDDQDANQMRKEMRMAEPDQFERLNRFMRHFSTVLDKDGNLDLSEQELREFSAILGFSTMTASQETTTSEMDEKAQQLRYRNRRIIKAVNNRINAEFNEGFAIYQSNGVNGDCLSHYATGYRWHEIKGFPMSVEYRLETDLASLQSKLVVRVMPKRNTTMLDMKALLPDSGPFGSLGLIAKPGFYQREFLLPEEDETRCAAVIYEKVREIYRVVAAYFDVTVPGTVTEL